MSYVELHARSAFSFLRGASNPDDLAKTAAALEISAVALLDRDGVFGAPRFYALACENGVRARVGAEITMEDGSIVPLLAATRPGYQNLCQLITESKLTPRQDRVVRGAKNEPASSGRLHSPTEKAPDESAPLDLAKERKRPCLATWEELARFSDGLIALTGDEEGPVRSQWRHGGANAAKAALAKLVTIFGPDRVYVEIQRRQIRSEEREIRLLVDLASSCGLPLLATGGVNYAIPAHRAVADVFTCLRLHKTLDTAGRRLEINSERHLKSAREMARLFGDLPEAVENSSRLEQRLEFTLEDLGYQFPEFSTPNGQSMDAYLRDRTFAAAREQFGSIPTSLHEQLDRELELISRLKFSGYFLIVWDICQWARSRGILVQGRGSAANSSVCYVLGITAVNPLKHRLLFDRFLNDSRIGRDGKPSWPDIDLDFPSGDRRESVIQEVYRRYGRRGAAMTANVITYRGRSTVREVGKVLGFGEDALDRFSSLYANGDYEHTLELQQQLASSGITGNHPRAAALAFLYHKITSLPRHLGQHSGGLVICQGQLDKIVPLENATMPDRTICQWDKEDCENLGIVKVDFLGLGMMAVMQDAVELCAASGQGPRSLNDIPPDDPETYKMICAADTVGVFQIESRAQMSTLPRFRPKDLYDLAMQVAIIRPGPITGNLVHPLIRRRNGEEPIDYIDSSVEDIVRPILHRTCGVILFQEQMLELAMKLAKFTGAEAEELRRAMGFTKDSQRLVRSMEKLKTALRQQGCNETVVQKVVESTGSFASYGFPESHAIGFAMLAYASSWLKIYRTAEFYASLLNNQPMGFYSPATLIQDGRRHDLEALPVCIQASDWACTVVRQKSIRIGLRYVKGIRESAVQAMLTSRKDRSFDSMEDFLSRTNFTAAERRALAAIGAFDALSTDRRTALWQVEGAWSDHEALFKQFEYALENTVSTTEEGQTADQPRAARDTPLQPMSNAEQLQADFVGLGLTTQEHPMKLLRSRLPGIRTARELHALTNHPIVTIAGSVICRQRPGTAKGFVFISLEDETGIANAVVTPALFERLRMVITHEPALKITGQLQNVSGVVHVKARHIEPLREADLPKQVSYDFH